MNIDFYMKEIESIPLLTAVEEKALATKAFSGDKIAQNKLVKSNLRFVVKIAKSYKGYEAEDLINIGAYKSGSNPNIDYAIEKINAVNAFLQQGTDEKFTFEETVAQLKQIFE